MLPGFRFQSVMVLSLAALAATNSLGAQSQATHSIRPKSATPDSARGREIFASTCANCHGLDGRGGERAPNIAENTKVQKFSDVQIAHIIQNGIPTAGMPAFHSLDASDVHALVAHLRTLQKTKQVAKLPGDPVHGKEVFFGKGRCSSCHMAEGEGGFMASDLSAYARTHPIEYIRDSITSPGNDRQARLATATTRDGGQLVGRVRNEDNFSIQLQAPDGTFYSVAKSDLKALEYDSQTFMPSDYGSTLSPAELNDLVSFLMNLANVKPGEAVVPSDFEDE